MSPPFSKIEKKQGDALQLKAKISKVEEEERWSEEKISFGCDLNDAPPDQEHIAPRTH